MTLKLPDPFNYGQDLACYDDLDANMTEIAGIDVFAQDLAHRLQTPRGSVTDDPNYGTDAREDVSASLTQAEQQALPAKYAAELAKDDRVDHIDVVILSLTSELVSCQFFVTPLVGPAFKFTADVSQAYVLVTSVSP